MDNNNFNQQQYQQQPQQMQYQQVPQQMPQGYYQGSPQGGNNNRNTKILLGVIAALLVVVIVLLVVLIMKKDGDGKGAQDPSAGTFSGASQEQTTEKPTVTEKTTEQTTEKTTEKTTEATTEAPKALSKGKVIEAIYDSVKGQNGYTSSTDLGVVGDWNQDGYDDILMVYQMKDDNNTFKQLFDLYTIYPDGYERLLTGVICEMVGGNNGKVGICEKGTSGEMYFHVEYTEWQGDRFDTYMTYYPWKKGDAYPNTNDGFYYFELHGQAGLDEANADTPDGIKYDKIIIGDQSADYNTYLNANNFYNETNQFNIYTQTNPGKVDTIDDLIKKYQNEYY